MGRLANTFDATQVDPAVSAPQFKVGRHPVIIIADEEKATKDAESGMLELTLQIIDGPDKGFEGKYRLNLYNKSDAASRIAYSQLSALCHVTGKYKIDDTRELHNVPFIIDVELQKGEAGEKNGYTEIKRVLDMNGNAPGKQAQPQPQQQAPAQGGGGAWGGQPQQNQQPAQQQAPQGGGWGAQQPQQPAPAQQGNGGGQWGGGGGGAPAGGGGAPWRR